VVQVKLEAQTNSTSSPFRSPGVVYTKMGATIAYKLGFGRSAYAWKDKNINFPMAPVSCQNKHGVVGNHRRNLTSRICLSVAPPSFGPVGRVSFRRPLGVHTRDFHATISLYSVAAALVRVWVFLRLFCQEQFRRRVGL